MCATPSVACSSQTFCLLTTGVKILRVFCTDALQTDKGILVIPCAIFARKYQDFLYSFIVSLPLNERAMLHNRCFSVANSLKDSSPKNVNYPVIYSPSGHCRCIWLSSFRRIQSELYKKCPGSSKLYNGREWYVYIYIYIYIYKGCNCTQTWWFGMYLGFDVTVHYDFGTAGGKNYTYRCILKHLNIMEKFFIFLEFNSKKQTFLYCRFIAHKLKYFKSFFVLILMVTTYSFRKIKNSVSQKIWIFSQRSIKKRLTKQKSSRSPK